MRGITLSRFLTGVAASVLVTAEAHAQAADETKSGALEEIVVTANKREQNVQRVPLSITAVSGTALEAKGILDSVALAQVTPGLVFNQNSNFGQPYIRGVGTDITTPGSESSVATYVDDVYQPFPFVGIQTLNGIERIEVLKGPQGTLYGRNATGGAINVQTRNPSSNLEADASLSYGNYNAILGKAYVSVPFGEKVAANLAVAIADRDGFGTDLTDGSDYNREKYQNIRAKIKFDLADNFDILLSGSYFHRNDDSFEAYTYADKFGSIPVFSALGAHVTILSQDVYQSYEAQNRTNVYAASARVRVGIGNGDLIAISAYQNAKTYLLPDFVSADVAIFDFAANDTGKSFSQELYYRGSAGRLTYLVGANYFDQSARFDPLYVFFGHTPGTVSNQYADSTGVAGYAEATYQFSDAFSLTGGVRISTEKKTQDRLETFDGAGNLLFTTPKSSRRWNNQSFKAVATYQIDDTMLYAKFESGFKSGSVVVSQPGLFIPPEKINSFEAGLKSEFLDRRARFNLAGFYYRYKNLQVQYTDVSTGTALVESADAARIWGIEGQFTISPVYGLTFDVGATYLNSKYTDFFSHGVFIPNSQLVGPGTPGNSNITLDVSGKKIVKTPPLTLNASVDWKNDLANGGSIDTNVSLYYSAKYYFDITNRIYQDDYAILNGQIRYNFPGDKYSIAVYGRNLTDTAYLTTSTPTAFGDQAQLAPPRQYGVTVTAKF